MVKYNYGYKIGLLSTQKRKKRKRRSKDIIKKLSVWIYMNRKHVYFRGIRYNVQGNKLSLVHKGIKDILTINGLEKLEDLEVLDLRRNKITEIRGLKSLRNLKKLDLKENSITKITGLNSLNNLRELNLTKNRLEADIKTSRLKLPNLEIISLEENQLSMISGLKQLVNLKLLNLNDNQITEIAGLGKLTNLEQLYLSKNHITRIRGLDRLVSLERLKIESNEIEEIRGLDTLVNLKDLGLSTNRITQIKDLDNLKKLERLNLRFNQISELKGLEHLINLNYLNLVGNPLNENEIEMITNAVTAVEYCQKKACIQYLKEMESVYNKISFDQIYEICHLEETVIRRLIEDLFKRGELQGQMREKEVVFLKESKGEILERITEVRETVEEEGSKTRSFIVVLNELDKEKLKSEKDAEKLLRRVFNNFKRNKIISEDTGLIPPEYQDLLNQIYEVFANKLKVVMMLDQGWKGRLREYITKAGRYALSTLGGPIVGKIVDYAIVKIIEYIDK